MLIRLISMAVGLWPASTSLSRCCDYCADCCGASGSAGSRKLRAQADHRFSSSLLKMRIADVSLTLDGERGTGKDAYATALLRRFGLRHSHYC